MIGKPPLLFPAKQRISSSSNVSVGENGKHLKMAKHHPDLIMCRKQPGVAIGRLCEKCESKMNIWSHRSPVIWLWSSLK